MKNHWLCIALLAVATESLASERLNVSMIKLIADPEAFIGEAVALNGYVALSNGVQLFLSEEAYEMGSAVDSVLVQSTGSLPEDYIDRYCIGKHAIVLGTIEPAPLRAEAAAVIRANAASCLE